MSQGINKISVERNQRALLELVSKPGNDICADCKARHPRWASHNLGIFICVNCASIHRKIGTHITKVKSVTLDSWTKEQVENMKQKGNINSNAFYNPNEVRHPPPTNMMESERDSELELYIRAKYQYKKYIDRSAYVASQLGPSKSVSSKPPRSQSTPLVAPTTVPSSSPSATPSSNSGQLLSANKPEYRPGSANLPSSAAPVQPTRSVSQPFVSQSYPQQPPAPTNPSGAVWDDLISLQSPSQSSSLPLQFQSSTAPSTPSMFTQPLGAPNQHPTPNLTSSINPYGNLSAGSNYTNPSMMTMSSTSSFPTGVGMMTNMNTGIGSSSNPFQSQMQQQGFNPGSPSMFSPGGNGLSNPFTQSFPPSVADHTGFAGSMMTGTPNPSFQPQSFGQPQQQFMQPSVQSPISMQGQPGFFQPQPQPPQQQQSFPLQQSFRGSPSPFPQQHPQQQPQQMFNPANPFGGSWQAGQQQWGGM